MKCEHLQFMLMLQAGRYWQNYKLFRTNSRDCLLVNNAGRSEFPSVEEFTFEDFRMSIQISFEQQWWQKALKFSKTGKAVTSSTYINSCPERFCKRKYLPSSKFALERNDRMLAGKESDSEHLPRRWINWVKLQPYLQAKKKNWTSGSS